MGRPHGEIEGSVAGVGLQRQDGAGLRVDLDLLVATGVPGVLYLAMAVFTHPTVAVILFVAQWGMVQVAQPLFSGLYNEHIEEGARATTLSLISGVVTIYISVGGVILGWLAGINLSMMFVILGAIIIAGAVLVRPLPEPAQ